MFITNAYLGEFTPEVINDCLLHNVRTFVEYDHGSLLAQKFNLKIHEQGNYLYVVAYAEDEYNGDIYSADEILKTALTMSIHHNDCNESPLLCSALTFKAILGLHGLL